LGVPDKVETEEENSKDAVQESEGWSKANRDDSDGEEDHTKGVHDGSAAGEVVLGSDGIDGKSNNNGSGEGSSFEDDHSVLDSNSDAGSGDKPGDTDGEDEEQGVVDWYLSVKAAAEEGADGDDVENNDTHDQCRAHDELLDPLDVHSSEAEPGGDGKLDREDSIDLSDETESGLVLSELLPILLLVSIILNNSHFDLYLF